MALTLKVLTFLAVIATGTFAAPQYPHNGYHTSANVGMTYMNEMHQIPRMEHQQDYHPYPYAESMYKQQEIPYHMHYSGMTPRMMQAPTSNINNYHQEVPGGSYIRTERLHRYEGSQPETNYGDQMYSGHHPAMHHYKNNGNSVLKSQQDKKQTYSSAPSVSHVKFNGMGTMYEWGN